MPASAAASRSKAIERRIAHRLAQLRGERGWSLEALAERTGISRATLSRVERSELSPTAAMLGTLCAAHGWTLSRLMTEAETRPPHVVRAAEQTTWKDPESGYRRRVVSPPSPGLRGELVEVVMPAAASVSAMRSNTALLVTTAAAAAGVAAVIVAVLNASGSK